MITIKSSGEPDQRIFNWTHTGPSWYLIMPKQKIRKIETSKNMITKSHMWTGPNRYFIESKLIFNWAMQTRQSTKIKKITRAVGTVKLQVPSLNYTNLLIDKPPQTLTNKRPLWKRALWMLFCSSCKHNAFKDMAENISLKFTH